MLLLPLRLFLSGRRWVRNLWVLGKIIYYKYLDKERQKQRPVYKMGCALANLVPVKFNFFSLVDDLSFSRFVINYTALRLQEEKYFFLNE